MYEDFVKDFGDGEDDGPSSAPPFVSSGIVEGNRSNPRRHFVAATPTSLRDNEPRVPHEDASIPTV